MGIDVTFLLIMPAHWDIVGLSSVEYYHLSFLSVNAKSFRGRVSGY